MRLCAVDGCDRKYRASGYCATHYNRERRKGGTLEQYSDEKIAAEKRRSFLRSVKDAGWTEERFIVFNYAQGGLCYLCSDVSYQNGQPMRLCMDHNHETGEPRGLLCQRCNQFLWFYEDPNMAKSAENYLGR